MSTQLLESQSILKKQLKVQSEHTPRIHCIANYVTANACANLLLAVGASPIMADAPEEADEVTRNSQALMINLGTPNLQRMQTISQIGKTAMRHHVPVVLDPVGCGTSAFRYQFIHEWLSEVNPTVIRGNFSEIAALSSPADSGNLHAGIDGANEDFAIASTIDIAKRTALMYNTIIVLSGVIDIITDGCTTFTVSNGCREMSRITGMGCMLSAYLAAIVSHSASRTPHDLAVAVATFGLSGEMASSYAGQEGLGTFHQSFWDKISNLSFDTLKGGLCIEHR